MTWQRSKAEVLSVLKRWFHKRNLIIVSDHQVKHIPIGVGVQLAALGVAVSFICWASYSTGSFMAARQALKAQGQALRSVTSARVEENFAPLSTHALLGRNESVFEPASMVSHVAHLEEKVAKLQQENTTIIQRVREKTAGRIDDLETIISKTGLDSNDMKKNVAGAPGHEAARAGKGGPYMPLESSQPSADAQALFVDLDKLAQLGDIVNAMPLGRPINSASEQSGFGHRYDPFNNELAFHAGLDLAGPSGAKVMSTASGTVTAAGRDGAYGNMVDIDHGNGITTRYGHMSQLLVKPGQKVAKGEVLGIQGSTGRSTGPHLHYEVRYHGEPMNPKNFLQAGRYVSQD